MHLSICMHMIRSFEIVTGHFPSLNKPSFLHLLIMCLRPQLSSGPFSLLPHASWTGRGLTMAASVAQLGWFSGDHPMICWSCSSWRSPRHGLLYSCWQHGGGLAFAKVCSRRAVLLGCFGVFSSWKTCLHDCSSTWGAESSRSTLI